MADTFSKAKRSKIMSAVKSQDTTPEIVVRKYLFSKGLRFRKNVSTMPGKPDIVFPKYRAIVFIHGCFWHGHKGCHHADLPKTNVEYWENKIQKNVIRDKKYVSLLASEGWNVLVVWECEINKKQLSIEKLDFLYKTIVSREQVQPQYIIILNQKTFVN